MYSRTVQSAAILALGLALNQASALPMAGQVVAGSATVSLPTPTSLAIHQTSNRVILDWQSFSIGASESVRFVQPGAASVALNRVLGSDPSAIYGSLGANGQVFLVNPKGVIFGPGARVDVGGLVGSSLNISNADFLAGRLNFGDGGGSVSNQGRLAAAPGGSIALIAPVVSNAGTITASGGSVALAAGAKVTLDFAGDKLLKLKVDAAAVDAQIANSGAIIADGGRVLFTARAAGALVATVISDGGAIRATSMVNRNGEIVLDGGSVGSVALSGSLDVSGERGGSIGVFGRDIALSGARLDASGRNGGGEVSVGGNFAGRALGSDASPAQRLTVDAASTIQADATGQGDGGRVVLWSDGRTRFDGKIAARGGAVSGDGGLVETSGSQLQIGDGARVDASSARGRAGRWLLDPADFTVAASGGDISGAALSANLEAGGGTDITISSTAGSHGGAGDIRVNDAVTWSKSTLTLNAHNNIAINADLNGSGTARLALLFGQGAAAAESASSYSLGSNAQVGLPAGASFSTKQGSDGAPINYTVITELGAAGDETTAATPATTLQGIARAANLAGNYALGAEIDAGPSRTWNAGAGFVPIGSPASAFAGRLDGLGHAVSGLYVNRPATDYAGLFGYLDNATLRHIGLVRASVSGRSYVGALAGYSGGSISDAYATGKVFGGPVVGDMVGGLVGLANGSISRAHASVNVTGSAKGVSTGGLVGSASGNYADVYATGSVSGFGDVGGLFGTGSGALVVRAYASGSVSGDTAVGGLVGSIPSEQLYVLLSARAAGAKPPPICLSCPTTSYGDVYATGSVAGSSNVGGLVGWLAGGWIVRSYAAGHVSGTSNVGGLVGGGEYFALMFKDGVSQAVSVKFCPLAGCYPQFVPSVSYSFWDKESGYPTDGSGAIGMSSADMKKLANFTSATPANGMVNPSWDFGTVWRIYENQTTPLLKSLLKPLTVTANADAITYNGRAYSGGNGVSYSGLLSGDTPAVLSGTLAYGGSAQGARNAGSYSIAPGGLYSTNYDITINDGTLTIGRAPLILIAQTNSKTYDGTTSAAALPVVAGLQLGDQVTGAAETYDNANVGSGKTLSVSAYTVNDGNGGNNYQLSTVNDLTGVINAAALVPSITAGSGSITAANKMYDGTTAATIISRSLVGVIGNDDVQLAGGLATFADKNVGTAKRVTATGLYLTGAAAGNYTANSTATTTADITARPLLVAAAGSNKVYDGTTSASATLDDNRVPGDRLSTSYTAANFSSRNVGTAKPISVTGIGITGPDAMNYSLASASAMTSADIGARPLSVTASGANKVYDGTTSASVSLADNRVPGDTLGTAYAAANFDNPNAGQAKPISVTGIAISGLDVLNYSLVSNVASTRADITARPLSISADAKTKVYGDADPALTYLTGGMGLSAGDALSGALARTPGESVAFYAIGQGSLSAGPNYAIAYVGSTFTITPAQLLYLADPASRSVGQSNPLFSGSLAGFKRGDSQATATTGALAFSSSAKPDSPVGSYAIDGGGLHARNYIFAQAPSNANALTVVAAPPQVFVPPADSPPPPGPAAGASLRERLFDPVLPCKNSMVQNQDGSISILADCRGG